MVSEVFGSGDASIAGVLDVLDATGDLTFASYSSDRLITVTDKLGSYGAAKTELGLSAVHEQGLTT